MKSKMKLVLAVIIISFTAVVTQAQTKFTEGKIVYTITMTDNDMDEQTASMMPKEMTMSTKGDMSRIDMVTGMGNFVTLYDGKAKVATILMDMMGNKTAMKLTEEDMKQKQEKHKSTVKYLNDTKVICGYNCKKAEVTIEGQKDKAIVWYTKEITAKNPNSMNGGLSDIEGFPLEYNIDQRGMGMKMTAKSVTPGTIDDAIFKIPEGYKELTPEQMKAMKGTH